MAKVSLHLRSHIISTAEADEMKNLHARIILFVSHQRTVDLLRRTGSVRKDNVVATLYGSNGFVRRDGLFSQWSFSVHGHTLYLLTLCLFAFEKVAGEIE